MPCLMCCRWSPQAVKSLRARGQLHETIAVTGGVSGEGGGEGVSHCRRAAPLAERALRLLVEHTVVVVKLEVTTAASIVVIP